MTNKPFFVVIADRITLFFFKRIVILNRNLQLVSDSSKIIVSVAFVMRRDPCTFWATILYKGIAH